MLRALVLLAALSAASCSRHESEIASAPAAPPPASVKLVKCALATTAPQVRPTALPVGHGYGVGGCGGHRRTGAAPVTSLGEATATGLDPIVVRRYLKRNIQKLAYCYERQLLDHPGLGGALELELAIGPDGVVAKSSADG